MTLIWIRNILYAWNLLNINWASVETCQFSRNAIYTYLLYSCFIYRHVQTVFQYQNKLYISPIIGLAMFLFLEPELLIFLFSEINKQVYRVTITNTFIKLYNLNDIYMRFLLSISLSLFFLSLSLSVLYIEILNVKRRQQHIFYCWYFYYFTPRLFVLSSFILSIFHKSCFVLQFLVTLFVFGGARKGCAPWYFSCISILINF